MQRPELLVITPDFPPARGGIQILSHRITAHMQRFDPTVVTLDHPSARSFDLAQRFRIIRTPAVLQPRTLAIVALNAAAITEGSRGRYRAVLSTHIVASPAAAIVRRRAAVPVVQYVHAKELAAKPALARFAMQRADCVVAVSSYTRDLAIKAGAAPDRIALIHPGVDEPPAEQLAVRAPAHRPTLLTISRLEDRYKGHDVVLRAMPLVCAQVPDAQWRVIGEGPLRPVLADRARAMRLNEAVTFLGAVHDSVRDRELGEADVFCMVSRLPAGGFAGEGFGIVYLEAGAHRLPVIAGRAGGAVDAVEEGVAGLLVDPEDHVALATAVVQLLRDEPLARRLGEGGRRRALVSSWERASHQVEDEIEKLLR